ncbi:MAG: hypothetical protein EBX54_11200, partial [Betaproteobacteria bacterium]|nr:hypothetical protein [Betaproteobacteria bacterium]
MPAILRFQSYRKLYVLKVGATRSNPMIGKTFRSRIILMLDLLGWLGGLMLAFSAVPQALESYRCKNSNGLTWPFLMMWFWGEVFMIVYIVPK